ncbi:MAG: gamma-glutamyl-gamma-aminobutyrate hydrolase family protein [Acidobacteriaceae bacterium]|jgi:putative glutamine amidotransferase|nr:gamma-glutamyl-gamma-aminobutyrate hydrolase family protein [Acidobacteriaceae bacterium]
MATIAITETRKLEDYRQAIIHVGSEPKIVNHDMTIEQALDGVTGLLLSGGDDVSPARYNETAHATTGALAPERDEFELALVREARRRNLPIFGICRGLQVMNVAFGGTLIQDIPSQVQGAGEHRFTVPPHLPFELAHEIWIEKDSLLATLLKDRLVDGDSCEVNSRHHQALGRIAPEFRVTATAPDGIVEAIELPNARFCLGVQWHPENFWRTGEFRALFEDFVAAASR